mgnify:FL=1
MSKPISCAVPGCNIELHPRTTSGVCRMHNHHRDFCGCGQCRRKRGERVADDVPSPATVSASATVALPRKGITLPAYPWEAGERTGAGQDAGKPNGVTAHG